MPDERSQGLQLGRTLWVAILAVGLCLLLAWVQWGRGLSWDEIEFYHATRWVSQGQVPFRDFWEHHAPVQWFLFAPWLLLGKASGTSAVIWLRWGQLPVWALGAWASHRMLAREGVPYPFALFPAALLLFSPFFTLWAIEYRPDTLGTIFILLGLWAWQSGARRHATLLAGAALTLSALSNLRLGPVAVPLLGLFCLADPGLRRWRWSSRSAWTLLGSLLPIAAMLVYLALSGSAGDTWKHLFSENAWFNKLSGGGSLQSVTGLLLLPFREADIAGAVLVLSGLGWTCWNMRNLARPDFAAALAALQVLQILSIFGLGIWYPYHAQGFLVVSALQLALGLEELSARCLLRFTFSHWALALLALLGMQEARRLVLDNFHPVLESQQALMGELDREIPRDRPVLDGVGFALNHEPAYRPFWFLSTIGRALSLEGKEPSYTVAKLRADPPGAVVMTGRLYSWMREWPELPPAISGLYLPRDPFLWIPGLSGRIPDKGTLERQVLFGGDYVLIASGPLADHPWFKEPFMFAGFRGAAQNPYSIDPAQHQPVPAGLEIRVNGAAVPPGPSVRLKRGDIVGITNGTGAPLGLFLVPSGSPVLFEGAPIGAEVDQELRHFSPGAD